MPSQADPRLRPAPGQVEVGPAAPAELADLGPLPPDPLPVEALADRPAAQPPVGPATVVRRQAAVDVLGQPVLAPRCKFLPCRESDLRQFVGPRFLGTQR